MSKGAWTQTAGRGEGATTADGRVTGDGRATDEDDNAGGGVESDKVQIVVGLTDTSVTRCRWQGHTDSVMTGRCLQTIADEDTVNGT